MIPRARRAERRRGAREHPGEAAIVIGLTAGGTLAFSADTTYMQTFLVNTSGFDKEIATRIMAAALFVFMLLQPLVGALSDRVGRKPVMIAFGILGVLLTVPILERLSRTHDALAALGLVLAARVVVSGYTAIDAVVKAELFPAEIRTLGVALPYAIANTLFGGTAEHVALWFKKHGHEERFYWYVTAMIALSLVVYVTMRERDAMAASCEPEAPRLLLSAVHPWRTSRRMPSPPADRSGVPSGAFASSGTTGATSGGAPRWRSRSATCRCWWRVSDGASRPEAGLSGCSS